MTQPCFQHLRKFPVLLPSPMSCGYSFPPDLLPRPTSSLSVLTHSFQLFGASHAQPGTDPPFHPSRAFAQDFILFPRSWTEFPQIRASTEVWIKLEFHNVVDKEAESEHREWQAKNIHLCGSVSSCWGFAKESCRIYPQILYLNSGRLCIYLPAVLLWQRITFWVSCSRVFPMEQVSGRPNLWEKNQVWKLPQSHREAKSVETTVGFPLVFTFVPIARKASTAHSLGLLLHPSPKERILYACLPILYAWTLALEAPAISVVR